MKLLLGLLLLLSGPAGAAEMAVQNFRDFSGGLNDTTDAAQLPENESPALLNVVIDDPVGSVKPRKGVTLCGDYPGDTPTNSYEYSQADGTKVLVVTDNDEVYETKDCQTWTRIIDGLSATVEKNFATVRDVLWTVGRDTHPFVWNGSTRTVLDGSANTPNPPPPNCGYVEFWKERVWCARTNSDPSSVAFSAITDSAGNDLNPSTGTAAWPATNAFFVDQDGGCPISGIKAYRDNLFVFKGNCGIWRIVFNDEFDNAVIKTFSSVGSRFNNSIREVNGLLYFVGPDGIYAFDGDTSVRVSAKIENAFEDLRQPTVNELFKTWTTNDDFDDGQQQIQVDTGSVTGAILLGSTRTVQTDFEDLTDGGTFVSTTTNGYRFASNNSNAYFVNAPRIEVRDNQGAGSFFLATEDLVDSLTGIVGRYWEYNLELQCCTGNNDTVSFWFISDSSNTTSGDGYALQATQDGNLQLVRYDAGSSTEILDLDAQHPGNNTETTFRIEWSTGGAIEVFKNGSSIGTATDTTHTVSSATLLDVACGSLCNGIFFDEFKSGTFFTSSTWTSDKFDAVTVSSWSTLDITDEDDGLTVTYSWRAGTDSGNVDTKAFATITPGSIIPAPQTDTVIQIRAQTNNTGVLDDADLLDATVNYTQGGTPSQTIYAGSWQNRYWVSATSGTEATNNNVVFVKSRDSAAWTKFDLEVGPMATFNDNFYLASSTSSQVFRGDFGTSDNGEAIEWYFETKETDWGLPFHKKRLLELFVDYRGDDAEDVSVGYKCDSMSTFVDKTVDMSTSGRGGKRLFVNGGLRRGCRFRVKDDSLDEKATVIGISGFAIPQEVRQ